MNNEEKNPSVVEEAAEQSTAKATDTAKSGGWWTKLSTGVKIGIIAGVCCLAVAIVALVLILGGGKQPDGPQGGGNGGNDSQDGTNEGYSITVVTEGGMVLTQLPIYIFEFEDGSLGDMVEDGGYAATDATGKASFNLPKDKQYAARIDFSLPKGYNAQSYYPIVSSNMTITVSSSILPDTGLVGVTYNAGSVIQDFTVTTTEGTTFTLSEVLKTKKAVFINFWYTTCTWCIEEFPLMQAAYEKYQDDLAIIALDPWADDSLSAIKVFKEQHGLSFDVAEDIYGLATAFGVNAYPTSVMIDRYGVITLIEEGAIISERTFDCLFEYYTAEDYVQKLISHAGSLVPKMKPNVDMPASDEIADVFEKEDLGDITYRNDEEDEYSWPFTITEKDGEKVVVTTNGGWEDSYSQIIFDVYLEEGEVLAFDYFSSTELGNDILYVIVNEKDIFAISGESTEWETCFTYVAEEAGEYEIGLVYMKDSSENVGDDCVYLRDLRVVGIEDIDRETYIYRFAATNPDNFSNYQDYVDIFFNENDGYYHVGSENGPLLLANLMGYTRFSEDNYVYNLSLDKDYVSGITKYANYSINANIYGHSPVTQELYDLLLLVAKDFGSSDEYDKELLKICCYYDAYGTDKQLEDPIKGLATFSAYEVIESEKGSSDFPNSFVYDRLIMPRGLLGKFTPSVSGTYLISSSSTDAVDAWIFREGGFDIKIAWLTYENCDRLNTTDENNCYMIAYLEAGEDYYIDIALYAVDATGTVNYRVERLGGEGYYRFTLASPGYFTSLESITGEFTETVAGGIDVVLGEDGFWREKREDGRIGSLLYADFTQVTPLFNSFTIEQMIDKGGFNFGMSGEEEEILSLVNEKGSIEACDEYLREFYGEGYASYAEEVGLKEIYDKIRSGNWSGDDYTEIMRDYLENKIIKVGYNAILEETIEEGDPRIGCVIVDEQLADILQRLVDKYSFSGVENSWRKLCYYSQYFCSATPK